MTQENKNIHSYKAEVWIEHDKVLYNPTVEEGLTITMERKGVPSKCEFTIINEPNNLSSNIEFDQGDPVKVKISKTWMFYGFIFTKKRDKDNRIKIICYDQLRYLQNKETYVLTNKTVGEVIKMIAKDFNLNVGEIIDSKYKIPRIIQDGTLFDTILFCIEETTKATGELYVFYDHVGKLTLKPLKKMFKNVIIDNSVFEDFNYESTIDKQTFNKISLKYQGQDGQTQKFIIDDKKSIEKWGVLQHNEDVKDINNIKKIGDKLLKMLNSRTRTLRINNAMGAVELSGGTMCMVKLDLGDIKLNNNMVVDYVQHKVEDGLYSMNLELIGGEFISTREKHAPQNKKENKKNNEHGYNNGVVSDWGHGVTVEMLKKVLTGEVRGKAEVILKWANAYKVNPMAIVSMMKIECGNNIDSYNARVRHNFGGITKDPKYPNLGKYAKYPSIDVGIERMCRLMSVKYLNQWKHTKIETIISTWAPASDGNNVPQYIRDFKSNYKKFTGRDWDNSMLGSGVSSENEAYQNVNNARIVSDGGSGLIGNSIIEHAVNFCIKHLGTPYSKGDRNSYKRNPDNPDHFDCSSMTYWAYADAGKLPKNVSNAWTSHTIRSNPSSYGLRYVPINQVKRGDILWKQGHVGLALGGGQAVESTSPISKYCSVKNFSCGYRFSDFF